SPRRNRVTKVAPCASNASCSGHSPSERPSSTPMAWRAVLSKARPRLSSIMRLFRKSECRVADDSRLVAGGVSRIAPIEQPRRKRMPTGAEREAVDGCCAARLFMIERRGERLNVIDRLAIDAPRLTVGVIVGKVGAHHDDGFLAAPQELDHRGNLFRRSVAHC